MATLVPCLDALRSEFNRNFPRRDKGSDGWIGDPAHQNTRSDHNPDSRGIVHAIDVDADLNAPGATMLDCVLEVVGRHRRGEDNRLTYVIYRPPGGNPTIWSEADDWVGRRYYGSNPHDKHAHFSASYVRARETDRRPFGVEDIVTQADRDDIVNRVVARLKAELPASVWAHPLRNPYSDTDQSAGTILRYAPSRQPTLDVHADVLAIREHELRDDPQQRAAVAENRAAIERLSAQLAEHAAHGPESA